MVGVIVFIKNPELGKVKTRLAASVGDQKALEIYLQLMAHTRSVLSQLRNTKVYVYYSQQITESDDWSNYNFIKKLQKGNSLGERMEHAFSEVFSECEQAIIIGSDCAQLQSSHIENAIQCLHEKDVVIGPTFDGGYYLLGMNKFYSSLFDNIPWSTEEVYNLTIDRANDNGLYHVSIDQLSDIDYIEDWEKYGLNDNDHQSVHSDNQINSFENDQVTLDSLPSIATLEYQGMEKNMLVAEQIGNGLFFFVIFIIIGVLYFIFKINFIRDYILWYTVGLALIAFITIILKYFSFYKKSYALREKDIVYNSGLFWKKTITIPFNRVQHCEVSQGPIDRKFNLAELKIYTAGGTSSDLSIEGLNPESATRIKDFIVLKTGLDEEE